MGLPRTCRQISSETKPFLTTYTSLTLKDFRINAVLASELWYCSFNTVRELLLSPQQLFNLREHCNDNNKWSATWPWLQKDLNELPRLFPSLERLVIPFRVQDDLADFLRLSFGKPDLELTVAEP